MATELDKLDVAILTELQRDADRTNVDLAASVGLSPAATLNRVRRLKQTGVIAGISAWLDPHEAGFPLRLFVMVTLGRHTEEAERKFEKAVAKLDQLVEGEWTAGETDALLTVVAASLNDLHRLISRLSGEGGAERVVTVLRLAQLKARSPLPLEPAV